MDLFGFKFLQNHVDMDLLSSPFRGFFLFFILAVAATASYIANKSPTLSRGMSSSSSTSLPTAEKETVEENIQQLELLNGEYDSYDGVIVKMKDPMDPNEFGSLLRASLSQWKQQVFDLCPVIA